MRIVMTGFRRPGYMQQTVDSWAAARGIGNIITEFHLEPGYPDVVSVCEDAPYPHEVYVNDNRLGVQKNPWKAACHGFESDDFVVFAEDDIVVGQDTVEYLLWAEGKFRNEPDVLAVSAAQGEVKEPQDTGAVSVEKRFSAWVWGTWADRWEFLAPDWKFNYEHQGWDYRINLFWCRQEGLKTAIPHLSRAQHIGREGGVHCMPDMFDGLLSPCFRPDAGRQDYYIAEWQ